MALRRHPPARTGTRSGTGCHRPVPILQMGESQVTHREPALHLAAHVDHPAIEQQPALGVVARAAQMIDQGRYRVRGPRTRFDGPADIARQRTASRARRTPDLSARHGIAAQYGTAPEGHGHRAYHPFRRCGVRRFEQQGRAMVVGECEGRRPTPCALKVVIWSSGNALPCRPRRPGEAPAARPP